MRMALAALLMLTSAAAAEDNPACAKFEDPMAYNACLARQGPRAGAVHASVEPRGAAVRRVFGATARRGPHGRVRMEFSIAPGG